MSAPLHGRLGHYLLLSVAAGLLFLVNLGGPSLWDIDEGNNAEAAREMLETGNWTVPTFNLIVRVDKPALLYWLQVAAYRCLGVNELAARLPSALAAWLTLLLVYELGRSMFGTGAGLLAALALAASLAFVGAAHFANPDALLSFSVTLTLACFWWGYARNGAIAYGFTGAAVGLGVLAKGPVGLVLPVGIVLLFLLLSRQLRRCFRLRALLAFLTFGLVAGPWYVLVGIETKWQFLLAFFQHHNVNRFLETLESHGGPIYYYLIVLLIGFFPWSIFLPAACWQAVRDARGAAAAAPEGQPLDPAARRRLGSRLLLCWAGVFIVFFSCAQTKLPNYILPAYPALALLTGSFLERWRLGELTLPGWVMNTALAVLILAGIGGSFGFAFSSGVLTPGFLRTQVVPELARWIWIGLVPLAAGLAGYVLLPRGRRDAWLATFATGAFVVLIPLAAWGPLAFEGHKTPKPVAAAIAEHAAGSEVRIATFDCFDPSLVFYSRHCINRLRSPEEVQFFLGRPMQVYLVLPAKSWQALSGEVADSCQVIRQYRDVYRNRDVLLVSNR